MLRSFHEYTTYLHEITARIYSVLLRRDYAHVSRPQNPHADHQKLFSIPLRVNIPSYHALKIPVLTISMYSIFLQE